MVHFAEGGGGGGGDFSDFLDEKGVGSKNFGIKCLGYSSRRVNAYS